MFFLNNVNIYILFEVSTSSLYLYELYIIKNGEQILLEHRPDDLGSGFIVQVFGGESEEKNETKSRRQWGLSVEQRGGVKISI